MSELTDIESVRQYMQKSLPDRFQDEDIAVLIGQASEVIERSCGREFAASMGLTRSFEFTPTSCFEVLDLAPYELKALTSVKLDPTVGEGTVLTSSHYQLRPNPARNGTFFQIRLANLPEPVTPAKGAALPFYTRRVDVAGNWGLGMIPKAVQRAANVTVESWVHLRRDPGFGPNQEFGEGPPMRGWDIPPEAWRILRQWQRPEALV